MSFLAFEAVVATLPRYDTRSLCLPGNSFLSRMVSSPRELFLSWIGGEDLLAFLDLDLAQRDTQIDDVDIDLDPARPRLRIFDATELAVVVVGSLATVSVGVFASPGT